MGRLLFTLFLAGISVFSYSCRLPGFVATYSITVDGKKLGMLTRTLSNRNNTYLVKESGYVKFLF